MQTIIDTHAHIYDEVFAEDLSQIIEHAKENGVTEIWMPNCHEATFGSMMAVSEAYPGYCLPMFGLHPCYVNADFEAELLFLEEKIKKNRPLAIGEIGLDLYWDKTFFEQQKKAFEYQCKLAIRENLWIDIHSRDAFWEVAAIIDQIADIRLKGIFHCFSGKLAEAEKAIELGFLLGIGGVVTFKNGGLDGFLSKIDPKNIVIETDAPYLSPVPYRGKRNEPAYTKLIAQKLADIYHVSVQKICEITTANAISLKNQFKLDV